MMFVIVLFVIVLFVIVLLNLKTLLAGLILLELLGFLVLSLFVLLFSSGLNHVLFLSLFCFMVVESIVGLVGLIIMVSFSGSDYLTLSLQS